MSKTNIGKKELMKMVERLSMENKQNRVNPILLIDQMYKKIGFDYFDDKVEMIKYIQILENAHYILKISLANQDAGFLVADIKQVGIIRFFYFDVLEKLYLKETGTSKSSRILINELFGRTDKLKNPDIGKVLTFCIYLEQFEQNFHVKGDEYTDLWKVSKLEEEMSKSSLFQNELLEEIQQTISSTEHNLSSEKKINTPHNRRAVETLAYKKMQEMNMSGNWGKLVNQFGVEFLLRVHFRKYEFKVVKNLILQKRIAREEDFRYIKKTLKKIKSHVDIDKRLLNYMNDIHDLEVTVKIKLEQIYNA